MSHCFFIAASWGDSAIAEHFQALAKRLVERGHQVVYLTYGKQIRVDDGNFQAYSFPSPRPTRGKDFVFLNKLVRQYRPHCMIANFGAVNVMTLVGWLNRIPHRICWYHTLGSQTTLDSKASKWKEYALRKRKELVYKFATGIVANALETQKDVAINYRISETKCRVLYYTLPDKVEDISPVLAVPREFILCPGRLDHSKGQDIVIKAVHYLKNQGINFQVEFIGAGSKLQEYQSLAEELNISDLCRFLGPVSHAEVLSKMSAAMITLVPSRSEAFGLVNIESMSVGTPVIASAVGGIPEIIRDGVDGFLVPPDDPVALAKSIAVLLKDDDLRLTMGRNARQRFLDVFEQSKNIEKQVAWFEELVTNR